MTGRSAAADDSYCLAQVRQFDRDRYLTSLFAPGEDRAGLLALYAFNVEIARTREMVREPMMGLIRLQWWRDAISEIYAGQGRRHQVVQPLAEVIKRRRLSQQCFLRLIETREQDLDAAPPKDMAALLAYAEGSSAALIQLAAETLGGDVVPESALAEAIRTVGTAWALTGLLRALPYHAAMRRVMLPESVLAEAGLSAAASIELAPSKALSDAVAVVAGEARQLLAGARPALQELPRRLRPAFLPAALAAADLRRLARAGHDPFDARFQQARPGRIWRLASAAWFGLM